jgi:hypothetical protein
LQYEITALSPVNLKLIPIAQLFNKLFAIYGIQVFVAVSIISFPSLTSAILATENKWHMKKGAYCANFDFNYLSYFNVILLFGIIIFNIDYGIHRL